MTDTVISAVMRTDGDCTDRITFERMLVEKRLVRRINREYGWLQITKDNLKRASRLFKINVILERYANLYLTYGGAKNAVC